MNEHAAALHAFCVISVQIAVYALFDFSIFHYAVVSWNIPCFIFSQLQDVWQPSDTVSVQWFL